MYYAITYLPVVFKGAPELLSLDGRRVVDGQVATLCNNLLGCEWPLGEAPSGVTPPVLDSLDILRILAVLIFVETHNVCGFR